jgi:hypothetical protein
VTPAKERESELTSARWTGAEGCHIMPDIYHDFSIEVPADGVFWAITTPEGLDQWWTKRSNGIPTMASLCHMKIA